MLLFDKILKYFKDPKKILESLWTHLGLFIKDDATYIKGLWLLRMGSHLNLNHPKTFSEKIQWLKLYYRNPAFVKMVDKIEAKKYVSSIIGEEYIIPTLGVWSCPDDINFEELPDQFVLKCNHNSGLGMYICKDKNQLDKEKVKRCLRKGLKENYYIKNREWPYKNIVPRILAEKFLDSEYGDLKDYKFFCFNGNPIFCQVLAGRNKITTSDFFDMGWNHQPFHEPYNYPFSLEKIPCPSLFQEMKDIAVKLSSRHPFIRVDLYEVKGHVYFGELTFYPTSGMGGFNPTQWDIKVGEMMCLPDNEIIQ